MIKFVKILGSMIILISIYSFYQPRKSNFQDVLYHKIEITASSIHLLEWNTNDTLNSPYVKEWLDQSGRTKELRIYNSRHELTYAGSGFYGGPIIKYEYSGKKITETFYENDHDLANDFRHSEAPYRFVYDLGDEDQILKISEIYKIDFTPESLDSTIEHLEFYKKYIGKENQFTSIFGYQFAYGKLNGINPELRKQ